MPRVRPIPVSRKVLDEKPYVEALIKQAAQAVIAARLIARAEAYDTGDYMRGIKVVVRGSKVYASATDWKSHWIEWGSVNNTPKHPIARGVHVAGLPLDERQL